MEGVDMWLTSVERREQKICAGTFGKCGKMIIKSYSIPTEVNLRRAVKKLDAILGGK